MSEKARLQQVVASGLRGTTLALRFGLMFILARNLPPAAVGLFGLYWAGLQMASSLLSLDVYAYSSKQLLMPMSDARSIFASHMGAILVFLVMLVPVFAIYFLNSSSSITPALALIFTFHLVFEVISTDVGRLLIPIGRPLFSNVLLFVRSALWVFPLVIWMEFDFGEVGVVGVVLFWLTGSIVGVILATYYVREAVGGLTYPKIDFKWIRGALLGSGLFLVATLLFRLVLGVDRFIVERALGLEAVGVYGLFASVCLGVLGLIESGVSAWRYPELIKNIQAGDGASVRESLLAFVLQNSLATVALMLIVSLVFPWITSLYLSPIYFQNIDLFFVIVVGVFLYCLSMPFHYIIYGFQKDYWLIVIYAFSFATLVIWAVFFMKPLGLIGCGIMLTLALSVIAAGRFLVALFLLRGVRLK